MSTTETQLLQLHKKACIVCSETKMRTSQNREMKHPWHLNSGLAECNPVASNSALRQAQERPWLQYSSPSTHREFSSLDHKPRGAEPTRGR